MPRTQDDERAERDLIRMIEERDKLAAQLKLIPQKNPAEGQRLLRELDAAIERGEAATAKVQQSLSKEEKALRARRQEILDLLPLVERMKKELPVKSAAYAN